MKIEEPCTTCPDYVVRCSHLGEYRTILVYDGKRWGIALCKGESFLNASAATDANRQPMEEHFEELDELMREGHIEKLMAFAAEVL